MPSTRPHISVIIAAMDRSLGIETALRSALDLGVPGIEVIVFAGGPSESTDAGSSPNDGPPLLFVEGEREVRAAALNAALRLSSADYVAFLAPGDRYPTDWLKRQVGVLDSNPDVGMVYCVTPDTEPAATDRAAPAVPAGTQVPAVSALPAPVGEALSRVMVRRQAIEAVGGFDEGLEFLEELDLWRRLAKRLVSRAIPLQGCTDPKRDDRSIGAHDPMAVLGAYFRYSENVLREDGKLNPLVCRAALRRLGEHIAEGLQVRSSELAYGNLLRHHAKRCFEPKVSIVIPVYNGSDYLGEAIDSALAQTYENREVIVVNDGSNDNGATDRLARGYGDRIRYFKKTNGGVATALNRGVEEMTGDYFSWLSHHDLYAPGKLEVQVDALARMPDPSRCALYSDYAIFTLDPQTAKPHILPHVPPRNFRYFMTTANGVHGCTLLVPRQAFQEHGGFDSALHAMQDCDLWFRMASTFEFVHVPEILVRARSHNGQGTLPPDGAIPECSQLLVGFVRQLSEAEVRQDPSVSLTEGYLRLAANLARRGFPEAAASALELGRRELMQWEADRFMAFVARCIQGAPHAPSTSVPALNEEPEQGDPMAGPARDCCGELDEIYASRPWRLTAPLRAIRGLLQRTAR